MCQNKESSKSENSDSDVSMTDEDSDEEFNEQILSDGSTDVEEGTSGGNDNAAEGENEEEEEDEVIRAIRRENERQRDHPPDINCEEFIADISFHPVEDIIGVGLLTGDVLLYKYSNEENTLATTLELHSKACRDIEFSQDGKFLFSAGKDKSVMITDVQTEKLIRFYDNCHEVPLYCLRVLDENLFATGDDDGRVKLWDLRLKDSASQIYTIKRNEDFISDIISNEQQRYLLCASGDGSLTTVDLQHRKFLMQSEELSEELTCLGLFKQETKLVSGSSKGNLLVFNWHEFGLQSDLFPGPKAAINSIIPITENIVVAAYDDGVLRATHLLPNRHLGKVGQHTLSAENVDISRTGNFIASSSVNNDIKFWNIQYFEDFERVSHKHKKHDKKKELEHNLPSSKTRNVSDFFSDLC